MTKNEIELLNKRKLKSYRQQLKSEIFDIENELVFSELDEAQIDCKVGKIENIFSPYDIAKNRTINAQFNEYLMQETEIIPLRHNLELRLHVNQNTTQEQEEQIKKAIKRHYSFFITAINIRLKKAKLSALLLYMGGILSLLLNVIATNFITVLPIRETLLIATWFFVWEATSTAFFDRKELKLERYDMLRIYNARVTFIKEDLDI